MSFYHGTSTKAGITGKLVPPCQHTFGINEQGRIKHENKVFFTTHKSYALSYAKGACKRVGGEPVVYEVLSNKPKLMSKTNYCDVYFDNEVIVLGEVL